ncbi:hypothetical protein [Sphingorhabdus sp. SMR4y]|uniref:hypothetical protein n=1 Tax=Sphingorhabdus sp. SMR4y TaxID=2584094 RepID=UPI000B5C27FF|nr:hypothetical protein [Sphingorhabdus sp. SMR4y]ASK88474.1 hypothetical protein SPHFLASMR4Y_01727 [Sphingorhabdus sp. SMR4y]
MTDITKEAEIMAQAMMNEKFRNPYQFATAAIKALEANGLAIVPVEPTEAMIESYFARMDALGFHSGMNASTAWEAMISAAIAARPKP